MNDPRTTVAIAYDGLCLFEFGVATELFGLPRPELDVAWYDFRIVAVDRDSVTANTSCWPHNKTTSIR